MTTSERPRARRAAPVAMALLLAVLSCARTADAQSDEQRAIVLFEEGRRLARDGRCEDAISPLLESLRYAEGVGPLLNLGDCYERLGRVASARRHFLLAAQAAAARSDPRREEATARARALEKDLSYLVVSVPNEARTSSTEVRIDAEPLPRERWGLPLPVDVGRHSIEIVDPPRAPRSAVLEVKAKGERLAWTAPVESEPVRVSPLGPLPPSKDAIGSRPARAWQRPLGLAVGGVGLGGLVVGAVSGLVTIGAHASAVDLCPGYPVCPSSDRARLDTLNGRADTAGTVATVGFVAGAALVVGGLALLVTAPSSASR